MKQYVTFKIKKIYLYILLFVLVITFCGFGYYKWCARHLEIELQIVETQFQHEGICSLLKETYQSSDIELDLSVKNGKTIMRYYGKATTFAGKEENYDIETKLDFAINAKIK